MERFLYEMAMWLPGILLALSIHEFAHAWTAVRLGDPTPKLLGRLTLDPIRHIDPVGLLLLILIHIGWAKPVPVNPAHFRNPRRDMALVAFAGPLSNLLSALPVAWLIRSGVLQHLPGPLQGLEAMLFAFVFISLVLAFFNLFPVAPLDGWRIVASFAGPRPWVFQMERWGGLILLGVLIVLPRLGLDVIGWWLVPWMRLAGMLFLGMPLA